MKACWSAVLGSASPEVQVFEHSMHVLNATMSAKMGCCLVFRKAVHAHSLLSYAVQTASILRLSNDSLEHLLAWQKIRIAKSSTKATRIKKLLESEEVKNKCTSEAVQRILAALAEQEEKRKKKENHEEDQNLEARIPPKSWKPKHYNATKQYLTSPVATGGHPLGRAERGSCYSSMQGIVGATGQCRGHINRIIRLKLCRS